MAQMQVFVSHNHSDLTFCQAIVQALRDAGADVWLDESDLGQGHVRQVIMQELVRRPVFIVLLSKAALASRWVMDECDWAYDLQKDEPTRILLPVVVEPLERADFNTALHLYGLKRIEAPGMRPYPTEEAVRRLLRALALAPAGEGPAPPTPQSQERVDDLVKRGQDLIAQDRAVEAIPLFERAKQLDPRSFDAWLYLGLVMVKARRYEEALVAFERALALNPNDTLAWQRKGSTLFYLKRYEEALVADDRALALDPNDAVAWGNKGLALTCLGRFEEALVADDRALALDPTSVNGWSNKGIALHLLKRYEEALVADDRALALDPNDGSAWYYKGSVLGAMKRYEEALAAFDRALALDHDDPGTYTGAWTDKAIALRALGRTAEAEAAERRAKELGG